MKETQTYLKSQSLSSSATEALRDEVQEAVLTRVDFVHIKGWGPLFQVSVFWFPFFNTMLQLYWTISFWKAAAISHLLGFGSAFPLCFPASHSHASFSLSPYPIGMALPALICLSHLCINFEGKVTFSFTIAFQSLGSDPDIAGAQQLFVCFLIYFNFNF